MDICQDEECPDFNKEEGNNCEQYKLVSACNSPCYLKEAGAPLSSLSSDGLVGLCGCGKPAQYMIGGKEGACNRYMRCLTREELGSNLIDANKKIQRLREALESIAEQEGATAIGAQAEKALREIAD